VVASVDGCNSDALAQGCSSVPVRVEGLGSGTVAVSAGPGPQSCVVTTVGGTVKCWGLNGWGQLGDGTATNSSVPVGVVGLGYSGFWGKLATPAIEGSLSAPRHWHRRLPWTRHYLCHCPAGTSLTFPLNTTRGLSSPRRRAGGVCHRLVGPSLSGRRGAMARRRETPGRHLEMCRVAAA
jgi:hypothetical protein